MDLEQTAALWTKNEQLREENGHLKSMLSIVKENFDLRSRLQSFNNYSLQECTVCSPSGLKDHSQYQNTCDERQFRRDLLQTRHQTSSPIDFKSFVQTSVHTDTLEEEELQRSSEDFLPDLKGPERVFGEIVYQLDKRILSHIFQCKKRFYGFTLLNIPDKIIEVSTHPLTGKVDEAYRHHLTQRHTELMQRLNQFGYKATLHPPFAEFIVNSYGILKEKRSDYVNSGMDFNNPDMLRRIIMTTAPRKLQKDMIIMLSCLCSMAEEDGKPLMLW